jgi:hypothetical protein
LTLGRGTGGRDDHGVPGDEALEVLIEPRDPEGNVTRVPGSAIVQVVEIGADGIKRPLSSWDISQDQLRHSWKSGLLTTGYDLVLPWKVWPSTEKLRVTVQFRLADGRLFEADRDINVRVAPMHQRPLPAPVVVPAPGATPPGVIPPPPATVPPPQVVPPPSPIPPPDSSGPSITEAIQPAASPTRARTKAAPGLPGTNYQRESGFAPPAADILRPTRLVPANDAENWTPSFRTSPAD